MRIGLIISTYNQPEFLGLVLASVTGQSRLPDQLLIADDGSSAETRSMVDDFRATATFPVEHCWQDDKGFRKTRILNRAILRADTDYLVFSDGDMLLHSQYIQDHCDIAVRGRYTQGRRICLNQAATHRVLQSGETAINWWQRGLNRRLQIIRNRLLMSMASSRGTSLKNSRGCNQAFWREDLLAVNGLEENMQGWGREDSELCARLHNLGRHRFYARHWALAFHLYHPELSRNRDDRNMQLLQQTIDSGRQKAICGLGQHTATHDDMTEDPNTPHHRNGNRLAG